MRRSTDRGGGICAPDAGNVFKTDFDKQVIVRTFERRGWSRIRCDEDDDWDLYWASVHSIRSLFSPENNRRLHENQIINHFPNHFEITRKDLMARNIKRYRKEREKAMELNVDQGPSNLEEHELPAEWVPTTFALPNDYALFVEEFRRNPSATWIAKPTGKAQGRGIFLVSKLTQVKKWSGGQRPSNQGLPFREPYIISKYIQNPLLVGCKKFDMRVYALVTNYRPLKAFLYRGGFCRFCVEQYSSDVAEIDNVFVHLTNVAIQKFAEDYNDRTGGKWSIEDLLLFIEGTRGFAAREKLVSDMEAVIAHSLKAVQSVIINDKHCFEMYGFDILLDDALKPWLLEVNASPSLSTTTDEDRLLKLRLINDVINVVYDCRHAAGAADNDERGDTTATLGDFTCIIDESAVKQRREEEGRKSSIGFKEVRRRIAGASWR